MKTPALRLFLDPVGRVVHHLNTIAVGLSAVESGTAQKPITMDISWDPADRRISSRAARSYALCSTIVFTAVELNAYVHVILKAPGVSGIQLPADPSAEDRFLALTKFLDVPFDHLVLGPLLLLHWRNRVIHRSSKAKLRKEQADQFVAAASILAKDYKNLDPRLTLQHFADKTPTLKDVSSLIAMTINSVKQIDARVPAPRTADDVRHWLTRLELSEALERVVRVSSAQQDRKRGIENFFTTHCPELREAYFTHCFEV